jgi:hypothetical protein
MLRVPLTRDHRITRLVVLPQEGGSTCKCRSRQARAEHVVAFLRLLLRKISGKLLVIWDGSPIHRAKEIKAFLAAGAAERLHLERLPGYAPRVESTGRRLERGCSVGS